MTAGIGVKPTLKTAKLIVLNIGLAYRNSQREDKLVEFGSPSLYLTRFIEVIHQPKPSTLVNASIL
jgi:hypothetical protein